MKSTEVIIVGGGPAGMTAAIQLKRYGLDPLLFESRRLGGLLWNANLVENYPGFPGGIPGPALVERISRQFTNLDIRHRIETVTQVDHDGSTFLVQTVKEVFNASGLVLATGTRPMTFPPEMIPAEAADRVFYEVYDLAEMQDGRVAIIGAGDAAFDYALNLAQRNNRVWILNRSAEVKALPLLVERVSQDDRITYLENITLTGIHLEEEKLLVGTVDGNGKTAYKVDALLGAIGRSPNWPERSKRLIANETYLQSSGALHMIGDLYNGIYRQTAISVGDGLKAAMKFYKFLNEEDKL